MEKVLEDVRSDKLVFISHCILNQNAKVRGIANFPGAVRPLVELLLDSGTGIYQMPCPEMTYLGAMRWGYVKDQYNNPMFRRHCQAIADQVLDQVEDYRRCRYRISGFIMLDASPVCGLKKTFQPAEERTMWGGMTWYIPKSKPVNDRGVYCEILQNTAAVRGLDGLAWSSIPEMEELGSIEEALQEIKGWL